MPSGQSDEHVFEAGMAGSEPGQIEIFALQPLERPYALLTIVALAAWLSLVRLFWRLRLLERFLSLSEK